MIFQRIQWGSLPQKHLSAECGDDIEEIAEEVKRGVSMLWRVTHDDDGVSHFVTRSEGRELVLVAYAGQELARTSAIIHAAAKSQGFTSIRAHTKRLAMLRMLRELEPQIVEYVARFTLNEDSSHALSQKTENSEQRKPDAQAGEKFSRNGPGERATRH